MLEPASRSESGYRLYGEEEVAQLKFIGNAKSLGLTLEEIRELVELASECHRGEIMPRLEGLLEEKLRETEEKIKDLESFRESLLYYQRQASSAEPERSCGETASFCGCLETITAETASVDVEKMSKI